MLIRDVIECHRQSARFLAPFLVTHVFVRFLSIALLTPLFGALLALTLRFSNKSALTDQDIARFLFTPAGAFGALLVGSAVIAAMVLDVAVMTATLRSNRSRPFNALRAGVGFAIGAAPTLLRVAVGLLLRVLVVALPFLLACGALYFWRLSAYDINYYLTNRPPEFLQAVVLIGLLLIALGLLLLERLTGWAFVLHIALFERRPAREAFRESRARMKGRRWRLSTALVIWLAIRLALGAAISAVTVFGLTFAPDLVSGSLAKNAVAVMFVLGLSLLATTVLNAFSNGALADLLNEMHEQSNVGRTDLADLTSPEFPTLRTGKVVVLGLVAVAITAVGAVGGALALSERITADADVDVIGHRGAAAIRPENTMASVLKAIDDGADWVEIDVQESADGEVIVAHDSDFMKSAGNPVKVWDATAEDLAEIDIGSWFDPAFADQRAPRLSDVLVAAKGRSGVIIELKYYGHDIDLENRVVAIVEETGMADQIATMSLKYPAVQKMRSLRPEWRTGVLAATAVGDLTGLEGDFLALSLGKVSAKLVERAAAAGKDVYVWTVNDPLTMSRMISIGVDGLITDDPALARRVIEERNALPAVSRLALWLSDSFGVTFDRFSGEITEQ